VPNDVNLEDVNRLYIGFGNRRTFQSEGGTGEVKFDDIRLNLPVCRRDIIKPAADFTGRRGVPDCIVNLADVGYLAHQWLRTDVNYGSAIQPPKDSNLLGWWKLDGNANDSSGKGHHGTLQGSCSWVVGYDDVNLAIEFPEDWGRLLVPDDGCTPALRPKHQVSASAWVYYLVNQDGARVVVKGKDDKETFGLEVNDDDDMVFHVRDDNDNEFGVSSGVGRNEWLHLAGTYDGNCVKGYVNGQLVDVNTDANFVVAKGWTLSQDTSGLAIGNKSESDANDAQLAGIIDDVRVYDYGLSQAEVAWLATDGGGFAPLRSEANLYSGEDPEVINYRDLAELLNSWLEEKKWPWP
jgi:hypothetical protein